MTIILKLVIRMDIILLIANTQWTFCDMTAIADGNFCAGFGGHWIRIASINISAGDDCPLDGSRALTIMLASVEHQVILEVVTQHSSPLME